MIMTLVLLIMLTVAALGYPHYIASAKKLIGAKQILLTLNMVANQ